MVSTRLLLAVALAYASALMGVCAHMIEFDPPGMQRQCFFEDLHIGDQMTLTWQSGSEHADYLKVDVWMTDPQGRMLYQLWKEDTGSYSFTANSDGRFEYCFEDPEHGHVLHDKTVSFNVHGVMYVEDDGLMSPLEKDVRELAEGLRTVKDEQEYLVVRDRMHQRTAESTKRRIAWWSVIQGVMLVGVVGVQVFFIKHHFEVRRHI